MKKRIFITLLAAFSLAACQQDDNLEVSFALNTDSIAVGPELCTETITVSAPNKLWVADTSYVDNDGKASWITVTPANGYGTETCTFTINTTQLDESRVGYVTFSYFADGSAVSTETKSVKVTQFGFSKEILVDITEVELENYAAYGERTVEIEVTTNVAFSIETINDEGSSINWLSHSTSDLATNLASLSDTGYTPKTFTLEVDWTQNTAPEIRTGYVNFIPTDSSLELATNQSVTVTQKAGDIIEQTPEGDSLALVAVARNLGCYDWSTERMMYWSDVELWETTDSDLPSEDYVGRVRSVLFFMPSTDEALPFELTYLRAAETIMIRGNTNASTKDLSINDFWADKDEDGEYCFKNLKYLEIMSYGIDELDPSLLELGQQGVLETLDISINNFIKVPTEVNPTNFPGLKEFRITACQSASYSDLSNIIEDYGGIGLEEDLESDHLQYLFEWETLETLALGVNYFYGNIPDDDSWGYYTDEDIENSKNEAGRDTLPSYLVGRVKKVLPHVTELRLNLNRLTGNIPDWILYHPQLSLWDPETLIFTQDGLDREGDVAGFDNSPVSYDYYYNVYEYLAEEYEYWDTDDQTDETL
ncbi:MAG: BACON domain-containing carbohydrate-binding protein [Rikenellaceae bacterium]